MQKKRILAWILSLVLILSVIPMQTFALSTSNAAYAVTGGNIYFDKTTGTITGSDQEVTEAVIPESIDGTAVTAIGPDAFKWRRNITKVELPEGLISIGENAFLGCLAMEELNLPSTLTTIGNSALKQCKKLTSIAVPSGVTTIGTSTFEKCAGLTTISLPEGLTSIGNYGFAECSSLTDINLPDGVTEIGWYAFSDCAALENIKLPANLTSLGEHAFEGCEALLSIQIPEGVTTIEQSTFYECLMLGSVMIPESVTTIGQYAFAWCDMMSDVYYVGSEEQWNGINIDPENYELLNNPTMHYSWNQSPVIDTISQELKAGKILEVTISGAPDGKVYYTLDGTEPTAENGILYVNPFKVSQTSTVKAAAVYEETGTVSPSATAVYTFTASSPANGFAARLYTEALGREADEAGLKEWTEVLESKKETGAKVAMGFVDSDEFKAKDMTDKEFIQTMYRTFLGREADEQGMAAWLNVLDEGMSRNFAIRGFAESDEFTKICNEAGIVRGNVELTAPMDRLENENITKFVARCYTVFLGRKADPKGLNDWVAQLASSEKNAKEAARGFVMSEEFQGQNLSNDEYVKTMYIGLLNREADPSGLADWVKVLEDGGSRRDIFNGFADSPEFRELAQSYGLAKDWKAN